MRQPWTWRRGDDPIVATAIHAGHDLRPEIATLSAVDDVDRLREEDPYTDRWTATAGNAVVLHRSRWEVDVNRVRDRAVYRQAEDCWGLRPWRTDPDPALLAGSCALYDAFYAELHEVCLDLVARHGRFVVVDLHSYNHRRLGPAGPEADPASNPEVNLGTATIGSHWRPLVDGYLHDLAEAGLDARENVRFRGAALAAWVHRTFPTTGCCLAVDVKKVFMDEHTGELDQAAFTRISEALAAAVPGLREGLLAQA